MSLRLEISTKPSRFEVEEEARVLGLRYREHEPDQSHRWASAFAETGRSEADVAAVHAPSLELARVGVLAILVAAKDAGALKVRAG